jgi:hypothetical protein
VIAANLLDDDRMAGVVRLMKTWTPPSTYDDGWMAGILDGEGTLAIAATENGACFTMNIAQRPGPVAVRAIEGLRSRGFSVSVHERPNGVLGIDINGGAAERLRALGTFQSVRLVDRLNAADVSAVSTRSNGQTDLVRVLAVEDAGERDVQAISTTTGTLIGEGFAMHNTGGYTKMFEPLSAIWSWSEPAFTEMDEERRERLIHRISDREHWLVGAHVPVGVLQAYDHGRVFTAGNVSIRVYSSDGPTRVAIPRASWQQLQVPRLGESEQIDGPLELIRLNLGQFNAARAMYMNPAIAPATPNLCLGILAQGKLIGCLGLGSHTPYSPPFGLPLPEVYLLSDFAVAPSSVPRLSKLVVMAAMSREVQRLAERMRSRRVRGIYTTVFTRRPVSQKYRGLMKLYTRHEDRLIYGGRLGEWTLAEALDEWKTRYADAA